MEIVGLESFCSQYFWELLGASAFVFVALSYCFASTWAWLVFFTLQNVLWVSNPVCFVLCEIVVIVLFVPFIRQRTLSRMVVILLDKLRLLPQISEVEQKALEAGGAWIEREFFSACPQFEKLYDVPLPQLTAEEQAFLEGPTQELCEKISVWELWKKRGLTSETFEYIKEHGFLGMIIPKEYGGLELSPAAHSAVLRKISSRSLTLAITVMVPNSLGPAELLAHYGTEKQKNYYLPRLANGREIPCFALTEPTAGSDAASVTSEGILFRDEKGELCIRLNWNKRYITLAAIATVAGLAFVLKDPEHLIGDKDIVGITCALVPTNIEGVICGRRHDPLGLPFYNCPIQGKDVVVSVDAIIGGVEQAGNGWTMLMECLTMGRGISLPALSSAGCKLSTQLVTTHALSRQQFNMPIGFFGGIEEPIERIISTTYRSSTMTNYTLAALNQGLKPSVITAMTKYFTTEGFRKAVNDGMDVLGGAGISLGPRNRLALYYIGCPIGITVEGANILTRSLIIFGQGVFKSHPFVFQEMVALQKKDIRSFDRSFFPHLAQIVSGVCRSIVLSLTRGYLHQRTFVKGLKRYEQKLVWATSVFSLMSDLAIVCLGDKLKRDEKLTGRYSDLLGGLYSVAAILNKYKQEGEPKEDLLIAQSTMNQIFHEMQVAFNGIFANFQFPILGFILQNGVRWWSNINSIGSLTEDRLSHRVVQSVLLDSKLRDRLTAGVFQHSNSEDISCIGEKAHTLSLATIDLEKKFKKICYRNKLNKVVPIRLRLEKAFENQLVSEEEYLLLKKTFEARWEYIQVDSYSESEYGAQESLVSEKPS